MGAQPVGWEGFATGPWKEAACECACTHILTCLSSGRTCTLHLSEQQVCMNATRPNGAVHTRLFRTIPSPLRAPPLLSHKVGNIGELCFKGLLFKSYDKIIFLNCFEHLGA